MTPLADAKPGDIYADANGKLWRVAWCCDQPMVHMDAVEQSQQYHGTGIVEHQQGGISGCMWDGFKRIWRKE